MREGLLRFHDSDYAASARALPGRAGARGLELRGPLLPGAGLLACRRQARGRAPFRGGGPALARAAAAWEAWRAALGARSLGRCAPARSAARRGRCATRRRAARPARRGTRRLRGALPLARDAAARHLGDCCATEAIQRQIRGQREAGAGRRPRYWNSLGMTLGGNGRVAEAEQAFREAARLDDKNHRYAYNLGLDPGTPRAGRRGPPLLREGARAGPELRPRPRQAVRRA